MAALIGVGSSVWAGERPQWASWISHGPSVWNGWTIAADPSVIRDGDRLQMAFTGFLPDPDRTVISQVVSEDGLNWESAAGSNPEPVILDGEAGQWDEQVGNAFLLKADDHTLLYYTGYRQPGPGAWVAEGHIGLAASTDGLKFERLFAEPVLSPTPGWFDNDALFGPSVVWWENTAWMVYTGHCWTDCGTVGPGMRILGAVSNDGLTWAKHQGPVMDPDDLGLDWAGAGVGEPEIIQGPDGLFYLFFSAFSQPGGVWTGKIGIARSPHPFGPWEVSPSPIITSSGADGWEGTETIAPSVLVEDGRIRLWYHGFRADDVDFAIGLSEATWPAMSISTDWHRNQNNPLVLPFGAMMEGETDLAIADPVVIHDDDDGLFKAWWSTTLIGPNGPDAPPVMGIRFAESPDGYSWTVQRALAFSASLAGARWDKTHVETPYVIKNESNPPERRFMLYYSGGNEDLCTVGDAPCYQIGLAFSSDGRHFTRLPASESPYGQAGLVLRGDEVLASAPGIALGIVADPTLLLEPDGALRMWMSSYAEDSGHEVLAFGVSHASSIDGIHWTPGTDNPLVSLRRPEGLASGQQPSVLFNPQRGLYEMWLTFDRPEDIARVPATLFQAFGFWHATSTDGLDWSLDSGEEPGFRWNPEFPAERWGLLTGVHVLLWENEYRMYYSSWSSEQVGITALCLATRPVIGSARRPAGRAGLP